ncbi:DUF2865 domain-containing protein [Ciceribacter selenitireducens]|uniref:DUF2865 domain-containing protein n=1 Tax=Ciceribacter selenitireducens TaxID=448181 RepID=UPI000687C302|nr:DUF2865 domain-containing protein [Ciceribacter selenitireducens]
MLLTLAVMFTCQPLAAQASVVCESLRLRLAAQPEVIADTSEMRRYSSAIARQNLEIRKVRYDMRRLRCEGAIVEYRADGTSQCGELSTALTRMESNKQMLAGKRDALRHEGAGANPTRARLLAAIEANGCNADQPGPTDAPIALPGALSRPGDTTEPVSEASRAGRFQTFTGHGSLRTLCVRTCDGAFFPISSNTSPLNFRRDAQICEQMCPETETELYYHSIRTEESADMVSAETGQPYRVLPTAFAYLNRSSGDNPSCGCDLAGYYRRMQGETAQGNAGGGNKAVVEIGRSAAASGTPNGLPARATPARPQDRAYDPQSAAVRQIGPTFLPTATSDIDLRNPALPGPQPLQ